MPDKEDALAPSPSTVDAYTPPQMARLVEAVGVRKANLTVVQTLTLGLLAGAFIAFGAIFMTTVITGAGALPFGVARLLGGLVFSLGLILVVVGGAELFTGNNLIVMAWADRRVSTAALLRNWLLVYLANALGAGAMVVFMLLADGLSLGGDAVAKTAVGIAEGKLTLSFSEALFRGILCNVLVCLAVWLCFAAHSVSGKILAILFPISAFVALGFEHSIANMYLIPIGMLVGPGFDLMALLGNLLPVTLGNVIGGGLLVALVYWLVYLRVPAAR